MEPDGTDDGVRVGAMLFTLVDPVRGHEVDYNRWYESDHLYSGCMVGPWLFASRRWVATHDLKDLRIADGVPQDAAVADPLGSGSYLATYFIHAGHEAEHFAWANKQVFELYEHGRGFEERVHAHTSLYFAVGEHRGESPVPAHMALDHPYSGLVSIHVDRADDVPHRDYAAWFDREVAPTLLAPDSPVDLVLDWRPIIPKGSEGDAPMKLGTGPGTRQRSLQMLLCGRAPDGSWDPVRDWPTITEACGAIEDSGLAMIRLAAPFKPTVPGTDTYTDELWS
ncbi:MAG: hypothetical protein ACK5O2_04215 [Microthrixaceae bacterium]